MSGKLRRLVVIGSVVTVTLGSSAGWAQEEADTRGDEKAEAIALELENTFRFLRDRAGDAAAVFLPFDGPKSSDAGSGEGNTHFGDDALVSITSGSFNSAFGEFALFSNTLGSSNTATGWGSLAFNTRGDRNTASGDSSLFSNLSGEDNSSFGAYTLAFNTTGDGNSAFGVGALNFNTTGSNNTAVGYLALLSTTTGGRNTAVGESALGLNTSGILNTGIGALALASNSTGIENTAIGPRALLSNETGVFNTAISPRALQLNLTGDQNVAIGLRAGSFNETGSKNIFIGSQAGANDNYIDADSQLVIHNNGSKSPFIQGDMAARTLLINAEVSATSLGTASDVRFKMDIQPIQNALGSVLLLAGKTFRWRTDEYAERGFRPGLEVGLIAQEVEQVLPQIVLEDRSGYKAVEYGKLTAVLVEAMKEQQKQIEQQQTQIAALLTRVAELEVREGP